MRKSFVRSCVVVAFLALPLSGCVTNPSNEDVGRIIGAVTGAGVGSMFGGGSGNTVMTVVGGIAGYMIGGSVGRNMDRADQERSGRLLQRGFEQPTAGTYNDAWRGRRGEEVYSSVTTRPYYEESRRGGWQDSRQSSRQRNCRSFVQETTIRMNGQPQTAVQRGTACYEYSQQYPNGMWVIQQ